MGTTETKFIGDTAAIVERLDAFHAYHQLAAHWADAVRHRLHGPAAYLLTDELAETATSSRAAAQRLASRMADLGAAPTADPSRLVERSPLANFTLPASFSDVGAILTLALQQVQAVIQEYASFLRCTRDADPLTHHLVLDLLTTEARRETEIESVL